MLNNVESYYKAVANKEMLHGVKMWNNDGKISAYKDYFTDFELVDFKDLNNEDKNYVIQQMNFIRKKVSDSVGLLHQLSTINMEDMRQVVDNLRKYKQHFATLAPKIIETINSNTVKELQSFDTSRKLENLQKEINNLSAKVNNEVAAGKPIPRKPGLTILQSGMMQQLESMFPDMGKLNLPEGNKEALEFARRLDADINMQVEMGEPAAKPYDCR